MRLKILQDRVGELTFDEQVELISCKYYEKQKLTYEEFVVLAMSDEIEFFYNGKLYQIDYGNRGQVTLFITDEKVNQTKNVQSVSFISIFELLDKFRIDGKSIKDIWNDVEF